MKANKEMAENGRVHPNCINAANPYHECGANCLEKIADGKGLKEKDKKKFGNPPFPVDQRNFILIVNIPHTIISNLQLFCYSIALIHNDL